MKKDMDLMAMLREWLGILRDAIDQGNGKTMCEASRMVLSVLSILLAYHPDLDIAEYEQKALAYFKDSLAQLASDIRDGGNTSELNNLYRRNIVHRLRTLEDLMAESVGSSH
jgi:hypothetical protein